MRTLARELGYFFLLSLISICLLPLAINNLGLTSEAYTVNHVERIFLVQISILTFIILLALLYVVRFLLSFIRSRFFGGGGGGPTP